MLANSLPSTLTLEAVARRFMDSHAATKTANNALLPSEFQISIDPDLTGKPVCLFGATHSSADQIVHALATLYGLRLLAPKAHQYYLTMQSPGKLENPDDFPQEVNRLLPLPLVHQYTGLTNAFAQALPGYEPPLAHPETLKTMPEMVKNADNISAKFAAAVRAREAGYYPAVWRLLVLAKPMVPTPASPPVPFHTISEAMRLDALMLYSCGCRGSISEYIKKPLPISIFDNSRLVFHLLIPGGVSHPTLRYGYKDDSGKFKAEGLCWGLFGG